MSSQRTVTGRGPKVPAPAASMARAATTSSTSTSAMRRAGASTMQSAVRASAAITARWHINSRTSTTTTTSSILRRSGASSRANADRVSVLGARTQGLSGRSGTTSTSTHSGVGNRMINTPPSRPTGAAATPQVQTSLSSSRPNPRPSGHLPSSRHGSGTRPATTTRVSQAQAARPSPARPMMRAVRRSLRLQEGTETRETVHSKPITYNQSPEAKPTPLKTSTPISSPENVFVCPICFDDVKKSGGKIVALACSHVFCKACLDTSFARKKNCPLCWTSFENVTLTYNGVLNILL